MSDVFDRLAARALGASPTVAPVVAPLFGAGPDLIEVRNDERLDDEPRAVRSPLQGDDTAQTGARRPPPSSIVEAEGPSSSSPASRPQSDPPPTRIQAPAAPASEPPPIPRPQRPVPATAVEPSAPTDVDRHGARRQPSFALTPLAPFTSGRHPVQPEPATAPAAESLDVRATKPRATAGVASRHGEPVPVPAMSRPDRPLPRRPTVQARPAPPEPRPEPHSDAAPRPTRAVDRRPSSATRHVTVRIGRIDVRAATATTPAERPRPVADTRPGLGLAEYLSSRGRTSR
jgi:hypothetical protein